MGRRAFPCSRLLILLCMLFTAVPIAGQTFADNLPVTSDAAQPAYAWGGDVFLVELSSDGRSEIYGTYLGSAGFDSGYDLAVGRDHAVYVVGESDGTGFPQQDPGQYWGYGGGSSDAFVAKFSPAALGPTGPVGTADSGDHGRLSASSITTGPNGAIVTALSAYVGPTSGGDQIALGLYTNSGSNPGTLLSSSATTTVSGAGWNTVSISATALAANSTYWIVYNSSGTTDNLYKTGDSSGVYRYTGSVTFGSWPSSFPSVTGSGTPGYLLYATVSGSTASTLGITGPLGSLDSNDNNGISASPITAGAQGGIVTALSAYINPTSPGDHYGLALYTDNGGEPGTLVINSGSTAVSGAGWNTIPITPTTLAANTTYWLAYNSTGSNDNLTFAGNGGGQLVWNDTVTFGSWPGTWPGTTESLAQSYLLYATLAGPSNPPATPLPTATVTMHLAYTYDNADRRTGLTLPDGKSESWGYDAAGRVNSLTQAGSSPNTYTVSHNGAGDITTLMAPNGGEQTWSYDGAGRITGTIWLTGTTALFTQTVTLDAAGQRTASSDSWGSSSYGYDTAGRLTSASYPDGSSEADQYDADGNRTVITGTTTLAGTNLITNTYDLADELSGTASTQGNTAYSYDGNGNQTASYGITGVVTNTYNDLDQLTNVVGPGTNVSYVYDGQGDRLRNYEQSGATPVLYNDAQDLAGGLSDLVSDGTNDYTYLDPGAGEAPTAVYTVATSRTTYLASDVLGSVRLATDPTGAVIGAGAYDAWGVYQPNLGGSGTTQLAGLQAVSPFGYAGQYYDAGAGTYDMRAREYNPVQGRFIGEDPQPYDPQVPVTINPYEYAGNMVTGTTDPSGQGWNWDQSTIDRTNTGATDYTRESTIGGYAEGYTGVSELQALTQVTVGAGSTTQTRFWVPIYQPHCDSGGSTTPYVANIVTLQGDSGSLWDIEHVEAYVRNPGGITNGIRNLSRWSASGNYDWNTSTTCVGYSCAHQLLRMPLGLGTDYPSVFGPLAAVVINVQKYGLSGYRLARFTPFNNGNDELVSWQEKPGLILYADEKIPPSYGCGHNLLGAELCVLNFLVLNSVRAYYGCANDDLSCRALALAGVVSAIAPPLHAAGEVGEDTVRAVADVGASGKVAEEVVQDEALAEQLDLVDKGTTPAQRTTETTEATAHLFCGCFPGQTKVAIPNGSQAIATIKVGELVLAEDPVTGKIAPEPVLALIDDGIKPLMAIGFSDGSNLQVTTNHPFYVDASSVRSQPGWVAAGDLRVRDRVRTASGRDLVVTNLRYQVSSAHVYTLTVATDHDFFVGTAQVLVHNANTTPPPSFNDPTGIPYGSTPLSEAVFLQRIEDNNFSGNNYAAAKLYNPRTKTTVIKVFRSTPNPDEMALPEDQTLHAEQLAADYAKDNGFTIKSIYSELSPCSNKCAPLLEKLGISTANITYSFVHTSPKSALPKVWAIARWFRDKCK